VNQITARAVVLPVPYQLNSAPPKMLTRAPLMVIYKKCFRRYATSRGRMTLKTKYSNCRHNFGRTRPVARFQFWGCKMNLFWGKILLFIICLKQFLL